MSKQFLWKLSLPFALLLSLGAAYILRLMHYQEFISPLLGFSLAFGSIPLAFHIFTSFKQRQFGIDIIAVTAILGSLLLHQYIVGIVILLMLATGEILESYAFQRAQKEIQELIMNAPTEAHKKVNESLFDVPLSTIVPHDTLIVCPGEIIPVDGIVQKGESYIDESALTGESLPVLKRESMSVTSGSVNQTANIEIRATQTSAESQYERIIQLVKEAQTHEAPFVRMADAYSARFTLITLLFAVFAWFLSHDFTRVLAVLVVATPCPLILATHIAFTSGMSRAAKRGIMIKNGSALEHLSRSKTFVFDKTGTLTLGTPKIQFIDEKKISKSEILRIAASIEQFSSHIIAHAIVSHAREHNVTLSLPKNYEETPSLGVTAFIDDTQYFLGNLSYLESKNISIPSDSIVKHESSKNLGVMITYLADTKGIVGDIHFSDTLRPEVPRLFEALKNFGIQKIIMLTGDKEIVAQHIAQEIGITEFKAECMPQDKISEVKKLKQNFPPVIMVGDGVNDAPALMEADMGISIGTRGSTAASEASDIVITVNSLERIYEAFQIGRVVMKVAKQGIFIGIGFSILLMLLASLGYVQPMYGAILQEAIDVVTILNALRVHGIRLHTFA